jgi:phage terminase large subunit-like protein
VIYPGAMLRSPKAELASLTAEHQAGWLAEQPDWVLEDILREEWWWVARPNQRQPPGKWFVWLLLSGRGFGKTRTAAEWLVDRMLTYPVDTSGFRTEWGLVAEDLPDAMSMCVRGPAGLARVLERRLGPEKRHARDRAGKWRIGQTEGKPKIFLDDGQIVHVEGAKDEDVARGFNWAGAWLDEFAKWKHPDGSWTQGIMPSLRQDIPGDYPRVIVATTPKLVVQLVEWRRRTDGSVYLTTGSTYENADNLSSVMLAELHRRYHGTRLGRQELYGELIEEIEGALWKLDWIEPYRVTNVPQLVQTVIGMDPGSTGSGDDTGLIAAGRGDDGTDYVLGDWTKQIAGYAAARRAWEMYLAYSAGWLVVEDNVAKKWLYDVLARTYADMQAEGLFPPGGAPPIKLVTAYVGKKLRAEPVAARYEQQLGRVRHAGIFGDLETQMISWVPEETPKSPDRVDALVHAMLWLGGLDKRRGEVADPGKQLLPRTEISPLAGAMGSPFR